MNLTTLLMLATLSQCPPGRVCPPTRPAPSAQQTVLAWHLTTHLDGHVDYAWGWKDSSGYVHVTTAPADAPAKPAIVPPAAPVGSLPPTGVVRGRFPTITNRAWYGGSDPHPVQVVGAAEKAKQDFVHLTFIGSPAERKEARAKVEASPELKDMTESMGSRLFIQYMAPDNATIKDTGLPNGGHPDVVVQKASGEVVYRSGAMPSTSALVTAVRKADPNYNARSDPGDSPLGLSDQSGPVAGLVAFMVGCAVFVFIKRGVQ